MDILVEDFANRDTKRTVTPGIVMQSCLILRECAEASTEVDSDVHPQYWTLWYYTSTSRSVAKLDADKDFKFSTTFCTTCCLSSVWSRRGSPSADCISEPRFSSGYVHVTRFASTDLAQRPKSKRYFWSHLESNQGLPWWSRSLQRSRLKAAEYHTSYFCCSVIVRMCWTIYTVSTFCGWTFDQAPTQAPYKGYVATSIKPVKTKHQRLAAAYRFSSHSGFLNLQRTIARKDNKEGIVLPTKTLARIARTKQGANSGDPWIRSKGFPIQPSD